jgi:hypothetical protein
MWGPYAESTGSTTKSIRVLSSDGGADLFNLTTNDPPVQGTMAWLVSQCTSCKPDSFSSDPSVIDFTGIPSQQFTSPRTSLGNVTMETATFSILVCNPRATIETREVRADGSGKIQVMDGGPLVLQGNLHRSQTKLLLAKVCLRVGCMQFILTRTCSPWNYTPPAL